MPAEPVACKLDSGLCDEYSEILHVGEDENRDVDIFSIHSETRNGVGTYPKFFMTMNVLRQNSSRDFY